MAPVTNWFKDIYPFNNNVILFDPCGSQFEPVQYSAKTDNITILSGSKDVPSWNGMVVYMLQLKTMLMIVQ